MNLERIAVRLGYMVGLAVAMGILVAALLVYSPVSYAEPASPDAERLRVFNDTVVCSDINADTTWTLAGSPYIVCDTQVQVRNDAVLTIEPGVTVYFSGASATLDVKPKAGLVAIGTASQPITFTSYFSSAPSPGDWLGISFGDDVLTSTLEHTLIEYATYGVQIGNMNAISQTPRNVLSSTIRYISNEGIKGTFDYSTIAYNTIYSSGYGIKAQESGFNDILSNRIYDMVYDGINFGSAATRNRQNIISGNEIWGAQGSCIHMLGDDTQIITNVIHHCQTAGIYMPEPGGTDIGTRNDIGENEIYGNDGPAIWAYYQDLLDVQGNTIYANAAVSGSAAVNIAASQSLVNIQENWIYGNGSSANAAYGAALRLTPEAALLFNVQIVDNVICDANGDAVEYVSLETNMNPLMSGNAICGSPSGFDYRAPSTALATGNWWGTNTPTVGVDIVGSGTVNYVPWISFAITDTSGTPHSADGVTPVSVTIRMNDGAGHTVFGVARNITVETSASTFVGGGTLITTTLNSSGEAIVSLNALPISGTVVLTATEYCGVAVTLTLAFEDTDVTLTKTGGGSDVPPGGTIAYTISYSNVTDIQATDVWITDVLPSGTFYVGDTSGLSVNSSATQVWWHVGDLPAHTGDTFVLTVLVDASACGSALTNMAVITTSTADAQPGNNTDTSLTSNVTCADVVITKTASSAQVAPGSVVTYTLTYANVGNATADNVVITDNGRSWNIGSLPAGSGSAILDPVTVNGACGDVVPNTALISTATPESDTTNNSDTTSVDLVCADVVITKTASAAQVTPGRVVTYTLTYANVGNATADNVVITDRGQSWNIGSLPAGSGSSIDDPVTVNGACGDVVPNTASISTSTPESDATNNSDTTSVQLICADVVITKTAAVTETAPGGVVTYTLTYANVGNAAADGVVIVDTLDPGLSFGGGATGTWNLGSLSPSGGSSLVFTATVDSLFACGVGVWVTNTASIGTVTPEWDTTNNADLVTVSVVCNANIAISKTLNTALVTPGSVITYVIHYSVTNGPVDGVRIVDALPTGVVWSGDTASSAGFALVQTSPDVVWTISTLPDGAGQFEVGLVVPTGTCDIALTNVVSVGLATREYEYADNVYTDVFTVACLVDLVVAKEDYVGPTGSSLPELLSAMKDGGMAVQQGGISVAQWRARAYTGDLVTYTIAIVNSSPYTATGVYVTETLPAYTVFVGGSCVNPPSCAGNLWVLGSGGTYSLTIGDLVPNQGAVVEFVVRITDTLPPSVTEVVNKACAWGDQIDLYPHNNCSSQQTPVSIRVMQVSKDDNVSCAVPGQVIRYTISYTNTGTADEDVVLTEYLPGNTTYAGGAGWQHAGGSVYTQSLGTVPPGGSGDVEFAVRIDNPLSATVRSITNVVRISGGNDFTLVTPLPTEPDLAVVKNDNQSIASADFVAVYETVTDKMYAQRIGISQAGYVHPGDLISYTIAYLNVGRATAYNVVLSETLPLYTSYVGYGWTDTGDGQHYTSFVGTLDPGQGGIIQFWVRVDSPLPPSVEWIVNVVEIDGDGEQCNFSNNVSTEETPVTGTITVTNRVYLPIVMRNYPATLVPLPPGLPVGSHPKSLVISENHNRVFVTLFDDDGSGNPGGDGRLAVMDLAARTLITTVATGGIHPQGIALLNDRLYIANRESDTVSVMDPVSLQVLGLIPVGDLPLGVAAKNGRVYVTNFGDSTLSIIDAATQQVINTVTVGLHPAFPAAFGDCAYVPNHSGGESVTVVCNDGTEVYRLREEWGYFAATVDEAHGLVYLSRRDATPGLYEIGAMPTTYHAGHPVLKKPMGGANPFAIAYNPTTDHILVVVAARDELHIVWPGGYATGTIWPLRPQNEGPAWHGGQGVDATGHDVWVTNYADNTVSVLYDPN